MRGGFTIPICLIVAACAVTSALAQQQGPAPVIAAAVVQEEVVATQLFVGTIMPAKIATIGSAVDGRVVERPVEEGDRVAEGQKLAQLLTTTISLELAAAEAEFEFRRQQLAELENGSRPEEITQAEARMKNAEAQVKFTAARLQRIARLHETRNAATVDELEEAEAAATQAQEALREAKAAYELVAKGPREELIAQARAQVALQQAVVERLRDQMKKYTIVSRFAGYVTREHTEIGQWVNQGDPIADVVALDEVEVVVQVVEQSVPFVHVGTQVQVEVAALPDQTFAGTIIGTVPQADLRARTFPVKVRVPNKIGPDGPLLKAGMTCRAALPVGTKQSALLVPKDAIVLGGPQKLVMAVTGARKTGDVGTVAPVPVQLGVSKGLLIQVIGKLSPGQLVVVQGNERLRPGQQIVLSGIDRSAKRASNVR